MPPILAGLYDEVNYSTADVQQALYWDLVGMPETETLVRVWNLFVQSALDPALEVRPNFDGVQALRDREIARTAKILELQKLNIPLNVLIETYGLRIPPQPWGNEPLVGIGQVPISAVFAESAGALGAGREPEGNAETPKRRNAETEGVRRLRR